MIMEFLLEEDRGQLIRMVSGDAKDKIKVILDDIKWINK